MLLLIDTREKGTLHKNLAKEFPHEYRALGAGDFWIPREDSFIIVERSTYTDFIGKIKSGRLWDQVDKCKSKSDDVYFVLENPFLMKFSHMSYKAVVGAIVSLTRKGIKVVTTRSATETHHVIKYLYEKYNTDRKVDVSATRVKPRHMPLREQAIFMLMGLNGIGEKSAKELLGDGNIWELIGSLDQGTTYTGNLKKLADVVFSK